MPTAAPAADVNPASPAVAATRTAAQHWRANRDALALRQPDLAAALDHCAVDGTWTSARDGSLTLCTGGQWLGGCSVPMLAGRALLRSLVVEPGGHCLLAPAHAGVIVAARDRLGPEPVLFVIQPNLQLVRTMLGCCDLSADLASGRLWFAAGDNWSTELRSIFDRHPGLAGPARFIQTRLTSDAEVEPLIQEAQRIIGVVAAARGALLDQLQRSPAQPGRTVVVAGSHFRLWSTGIDAVRAMVESTSDVTVVAHDTDNPLTATPLALARATDGAATIVAVDLARADAADLVPHATRWITWLTHPAVPATGAPGDHLIVPDPTWRDAALRAGWHADHVHVGVPRVPTLPPPTSTTLAIIADTLTIDVPPAIAEFSSHRMLWESIEAELTENPLAVAEAAPYLTSRAKQLGVDPAELNVALFIAALIEPAYVQGLARLLLRGRVPVRLWGQGWDDIPEFADHAAGPVTDDGTLRSALPAAAAVVRPTPGHRWHPADACGRPVISTVGQTSANWATHAAAAVRGQVSAKSGHAATLNDVLQRLVAA